MSMSTSPAIGPGSTRQRHAIGITVRNHQARLEIAAEGGAGRRPAKGADAPIGQSREAHRSARPHHSPEGGHNPRRWIKNVVHATPPARTQGQAVMRRPMPRASSQMDQPM